MFEQTFKNFDDVLWKEAGCSSSITLMTSKVAKAMEAEQQGKTYERKQSALAELKQSLLQKAFAGEL